MKKPKININIEENDVPQSSTPESPRKKKLEETNFAAFQSHLKELSKVIENQPSLNPFINQNLLDLISEVQEKSSIAAPKLKHRKKSFIEKGYYFFLKKNLIIKKFIN